MIFPVAVYAHEEGEESNTHSESVEAEVDGDRMERFERAKATLQLRLSEKEKTRLANRCVKAQDSLSKIHDRLDARTAIIAKRFDLIEVHLIAIQKRLINKQIDTSIIDLLISNFQKLTTQYDGSLFDYQTSLDDVLAVGCTTEPETFKALLEEVRTKRQTFVNSIEAIKNFTKVDLKTSFETLRTRLSTGDTE